MATSDVLQFNYCIENGVARNAVKTFAGMLGETFEQYKKLWIEYLKLRNYCEGANIKLPFQLFESESVNNIMTQSQVSKNCTEFPTMLTNQTSCENLTVSSSVYESNSNAHSLDNTLDSNKIVSNDNKYIQKQTQRNKLLRSPVLVKKRIKSKKSNIAFDHLTLNDSEESNASVSIKENIAIVLNSSEEDISKTPMEFKENEHLYIEKNDDEIECTPLSKLPKKLGLSKLYNIDTTLLRNGKKLKQTRLELFPNKAKVNINYKKQEELTPLKLQISPTSNRNIEQSFRDFGSIKAIDEEIIDDSPTKRKESKMKIKNLKLKKKSPTKLIEKSNKKDNDMVSKFIANKIDGEKLFLSNKGCVNSSQCLSVHTSAQKDESCLIKRFETFNTPNSENVRRKCHSSSISPIFFNNVQLTSKVPEKNIGTVDIIGNESQINKRKLSKLISETNNDNSSECGDETFCLLGERLKEKSTSSVGNTKSNKYELPESTSDDSPSVKKSLMDSFDVVPEKKDVFVHKTKNKAERAKMSGISCWECEKYYANLGLTEREIKTRQNQCSRHRTKHIERQSTPDGFWDPLFPDTFSSSFQGGYFKTN